MNFLQETKELKIGRKVYFAPMNPKDRKVKMLLGFSLIKKRTDFVPAPPGAYIWGPNKRERVPLLPKRKNVANQPTPVASNKKKFPALASLQNKNQRKKSLKNTTRNNQILFDRKDMSLLLTAIFTAVVTALGRLNEEVGKAVRVAMSTMTHTAAVLKGSKVDASKPAPIPSQGEIPLPAPTLAEPTQTESEQAKTVQSEPEQVDSTQAKPAEVVTTQAKPKKRKAKPKKSELPKIIYLPVDP